MVNWVYMGVSKNRGTPKWMVFDGKAYEIKMDGKPYENKMDDSGVPLFLETSI